MVGKIKSYNPKNRYGFITSGDVDFRFHKNDWEMRLPPAQGMSVEFSQVETELGMRAEHVKGARK